MKKYRYFLLLSKCKCGYHSNSSIFCNIAFIFKNNFNAFTLVPNIRMNHHWYHHTSVYNSNLVFVMILHQKVINGRVNDLSTFLNYCYGTTVFLGLCSYSWQICIYRADITLLEECRSDGFQILRSTVISETLHYLCHCDVSYLKADCVLSSRPSE